MNKAYEKFVELIDNSVEKHVYTEFILELLCYCMMSGKLEDLTNESLEEVDYWIEENYRFQILINSFSNKKNELSEKIDEAFKKFRSTKINEKSLSLFRIDLTRVDRENQIVDAVSLIDDLYRSEGQVGTQQVFNQLLNFYMENDSIRTGIYTPIEITELLTGLATTNSNYINDIYDPSCGSGNFLISVAQLYPKIKVYGQESNPTQYRLAIMNLLVNDVADFDLQFGNALDEDGFTGRQFDIVMTNPPYSLNWSGEWNKQFEPFHTLAPKSKADYAFVQQMLYHLKENGTMAVLLPLGALFRGGKEQQIREQLINELNYLDAVIQLPENMFLGTAISTCLLIAKKNRSTEEIIFIDASREFDKGRNRNYLNNGHLEKIVKTYRDMDVELKYSYLATREEIASKEYDLSLSKYVDRFEESKELDITNLEGEINLINNEIDQLERQIQKYYKLLD